ncbi:hypothetical protein ACSTI5_00155, partial [Vibrio parahaemolyticus]
MGAPQFDQLPQCGKAQRFAEHTVHAAVEAPNTVRVVCRGGDGDNRRTLASALMFDVSHALRDGI